MKAIRKKPGCAPEVIEVENTLKALQDEVGGYIEVITLPYGAALICNEEGRLHGLPYNCCVFGTSFVGTVLIVGTKGEEFCDVPPIDGFVEVQTMAELKPCRWCGAKMRENNEI